MSKLQGAALLGGCGRISEPAVYGGRLVTQGGPILTVRSEIGPYRAARKNDQARRVPRRAWRIATEVTPNNPYSDYCHKSVAIQSFCVNCSNFCALDPSRTLATLLATFLVFNECF